MNTPKTKYTGKAFTLVELIIVVAILSIISGGAYIGIQRSQIRVMNSKVIVDLSAIENALEQYRKDYDGKYPIPALGEDKNLNCFYTDTSYAHDCGTAGFIQSQIDNNLLTKRYLQEVPTDPRIKSRYAYGVTADGLYYQIAGLIENDDGTFIARVFGNLDFTYPLKSLIRSFDGPDFVMDLEGYLPYSPDRFSISATLYDVNDNVEIDGKQAADGAILSPDSTVETDNTGTATLYFSDGSITFMEENSKFQLLSDSEVPQNDKDGIITKIRLKLFSGKIWNKVVRLSKESEFSVETTSAIAGVRGTEFGIDADNNTIIILNGEVEFQGGQIVKSDGTMFNEYNIPKDDDNLGLATQINFDDQQGKNLLDKYYIQRYNNNLKPRILEIDVPNKKLNFELIQKDSDNPFDFPEPNKVLVFEEETPNLLKTWNIGANEFTVDDEAGTIDITAGLNTFFTDNMGKGVIFIFEDEEGNRTAKSSPSIVLKPKTKLTYAMLYGGGFVKKEGKNVVLNEVKIVAFDNINRIAASSNKQLIATAKYSDNSTIDVTGDCNWSSDGVLGDVSGSGSYIANANADGVDNTIKCKYNTTDWGIQGGIEVLLEIKASCFGGNLLNNNATGDDNGYWDDIASSCWLLADVNQNCNQGCNVQIGSICRDTSNNANDPNSYYPNQGINWDDDNAICDILVSQSDLDPNVAVLSGDSNNDQFSAPFVVNINGFSTQCWSRDPIADKPTLCEENPPANRYRVCSCV